MSVLRAGPLGVLVDSVRGSLWPIPFIGILIAVGLGVLLPAVDGGLAFGDHPFDFAFGGGPAAARDLLNAIAGSLISVTGLVFSLTVLALQLSSSQYSPRLLQTFVTDRVVQLTLAQLVLTFVYALTVLRTVRTADATTGDSAFVPRLSISVAYLLTLGSVVALVLFIGHLASVLRVETMLRDVHDESTSTIARELGGREGRDPGETGPGGPGPRGREVLLTARSSGFLVGLDAAAAAAAAAEARVVVELGVRMGDSVVEGTPVARARLEPGADPNVEVLTGRLDAALQLHFERSASRDVAYGLRKVVDIALRALSPGINDPTTAVHALSHASALLGQLAVMPADERVIRDEAGNVRVIVPPWDLPTLLQLAMEEPLHFAEGQPAVLRRLAGLLREFAWRARGRGCDDLVLGYADELVDSARRSTQVPEAETSAWRGRVVQALAGEWPAGRR
ncbi:hypothetical protein A7K94_0214845 [Modestobacter sp. VKM Ac-2676]|nr:hypothetical protein A7K94_0214845 [Modestobacter sp. VKM Ac-2676]